MSLKSKIISLTTIDVEMFMDEEGNFPTFITLLTSPNPDHVVTLVVGRMTDLFIEYAQEFPWEDFTVVHKSAEHIRDKTDDTTTLITSDTLALVLNYEDSGDRLITLELGYSQNDFSIH